MFHACYFWVFSSGQVLYSGLWRFLLLFHRVTKCQFAIDFPKDLSAKANVYTFWSFFYFYFLIIISCLRNHAHTESHATYPVLPACANKNTASKNETGRSTLKHDTKESKLKVKTQQKNIPFGCFGLTEMTCVAIYVPEMIKRATVDWIWLFRIINCACKKCTFSECNTNILL